MSIPSIRNNFRYYLPDTKDISIYLGLIVLVITTFVKYIKKMEDWKNQTGFMKEWIWKIPIKIYWFGYLGETWVDIRLQDGYIKDKNIG